MPVMEEMNNSAGNQTGGRLRERLGEQQGEWTTARVWQGESGQESQACEVGKSLRVHIRWMIRRDMPEVLGIEDGSFENPWSEEDFLRCLRQRNCIGMVAEHGERIAGFMVYELHKNRLHILDFAVMAEYRRKGIGLQMIAKLLAKLSSHRRTKVTLEIRETNLAAQMFFSRQGFKALKVLRSYFEDSGEDAYLMQYQIGQANEFNSLADREAA
jgi:ribosomal-protein-alanine N-acetyltransferase